MDKIIKVEHKFCLKADVKFITFEKNVANVFSIFTNFA